MAPRRARRYIWRYLGILIGGASVRVECDRRRIRYCFAGAITATLSSGGGVNVSNCAVTVS